MRFSVLHAPEEPQMRKLFRHQESFFVKEDYAIVPGSQQADVCIICALEEEAHAVEQVVSELCQVAFIAGTTDDGHMAYRSTTITNSSGEPLTLVILYQTR